MSKYVTLSALGPLSYSDPRVVAALQPWAEISERLRRFQTDHYQLHVSARTRLNNSSSPMLCATRNSSGLCVSPVSRILITLLT